jgi:hypothetical protein
MLLYIFVMLVNIYLLLLIAKKYKQNATNYTWLNLDYFYDSYGYMD